MQHRKFILIDENSSEIEVKKEEFKTIKDFPKYEVGNFGSIRRLKNKRYRIVQTKEDSNRYQYVELFLDGKRYTRGLALLVAKHFLPNVYHQKRVRCVDRNPKNCFVENLEWI